MESPLVERMERPRVSVVVPYYDVSAAYLSEALRSLVQQTLSGWEAIVVDDAAPVSAEGVVRAEFGNDDRIRVVLHERNRGLGAARNTGIREARSDIIAMLDGDDRLASTFLQRMTDALAATPTAGWAWTDLELFGGTDGAWRFPTPLPPACPAHLDYRGGSSVIRRSLWEAVDGYTEDPSLDGLEDLDFWLGALGVGAVPIHVPGLLYQWRIRDDSMTERVSPSSHRQRMEILRRRRSAFARTEPSCDICGGRRPAPLFLSGGYFNASVHALRRKERLRALRMSLLSVLLDRRNPSFRRQFRRTLNPMQRRRKQRASSRKD